MRRKTHRLKATAVLVLLEGEGEVTRIITLGTSVPTPRGYLLLLLPEFFMHALNRNSPHVF